MIFEYVNIFLWVYGVFFAFVVLFGFAVQRNKERGYVTGTKIDPDEVTVLIPFRNEEERLPELLRSIQELDRYPRRFIFIDDHSDDASVAIIEEALQGIPFEIIRLKDSENLGKKYAIRAGAAIVETQLTLTWDADIQVGSDYFSALSKLEEADLYVLPAILTSKNFKEQLFTFDVVLANAVNNGLSGWRRPIFASGANLLYRSQLFNDLDSFDEHKNISSGDDTFLLRDFVKAKANVRVYSDPTVAVYTPAPSSMREYLDQRLRWVSKTNALGDFLNTLVAGLQLGFMASFLILIVWTALSAQWFFLVYLLICKILTDFLVFSAYFKRIGKSALLLMLPIVELWFPIYSVLLAVLLLFYRPKWKGREVVTRR